MYALKELTTDPEQEGIVLIELFSKIDKIVMCKMLVYTITDLLTTSLVHTWFPLFINYMYVLFLKIVEHFYKSITIQ